MESKALQKAKEAIARRNALKAKPVKKERSYKRSVLKPSETVLYARKEDKIKSLTSQLTKANNTIQHISSLFDDRKNVVPVFMALRTVDDFLCAKYNIKVSDIYVLSQADLEDIPFTTDDYDVYALNRLIKAGFVKSRITKGNKTYFTMPAAKLFLNELTKEVKKVMMPLLKIQ